MNITIKNGHVLRELPFRLWLYLNLKHNLFNLAEGQQLPKWFLLIKAFLFPISFIMLQWRPYLFGIRYNSWNDTFELKQPGEHESISLELIFDVINRIKRETEERIQNENTDDGRTSVFNIMQSGTKAENGDCS